MTTNDNVPEIRDTSMEILAQPMWPIFYSYAVVRMSTAWSPWVFMNSTTTAADGMVIAGCPFFSSIRLK